MLEEVLDIMLRSNRPEVFCKKDVLRNFTNFTGKHLCQRLLFNKVSKFFKLLKKSLWHRCFPVNFMKFLRTPSLTEHLRWLLLDVSFRLKLEKSYYGIIWWLADKSLSGRHSWQRIILIQQKQVPGRCSFKKMSCEYTANLQEKNPSKCDFNKVAKRLCFLVNFEKTVTHLFARTLTVD